MKIANFIFNIFSFLLMLCAIVFPSISTLLIGTFGGAFGTREEQSQVRGAWVIFLVFMIFGALSIALLIESIVYYANRKKVTAKRYLVFQCINAGSSILMYLVMAIMFICYIYDSFFSNWAWEILFVPFVITGILFNGIVIVLSVIDYKSNRNNGYSDYGNNNGYYVG